MEKRRPIYSLPPSSNVRIILLFSLLQNHSFATRQSFYICIKLSSINLGTMDERAQPPLFTGPNRSLRIILPLFHGPALLIATACLPFFVHDPYEYLCMALIQAGLLCSMSEPYAWWYTMLGITLFLAVSSGKELLEKNEYMWARGVEDLAIRLEGEEVEEGGQIGGEDEFEDPLMWNHQWGILLGWIQRRPRERRRAWRREGDDFRQWTKLWRL